MNRTKLTIDGSHTYIGEGETLLSAIRRSFDAHSIETPCNAQKTCGKCKVFVLGGSLSPLSQEEKQLLSPSEAAAGMRLACAARAVQPLDEINLRIPQGARGSAEVFASGTMPAGKPDPILHKQYISEANEPATAVYLQNSIIGKETGNTCAQKCYGIAADIGTTTVACCLIDLETGDICTSASAINPQTSLGGDVLTRIHTTMQDPEGLAHLQKLIIGCLNTLGFEMLQNAGIPKESVYCCSVAANTVMLHLLLGVDPAPLATAPYTPVFLESQDMPAAGIGLICCSDFARLITLPAVSAYIGADIVAGVYISGIDRTDQNILFIDIGTNGEIVLSQKGRMLACSCAAGPALEGMNISCGMRACVGAVEHVEIRDGMFALSAIGGKPPKGLCGSGVLEALSALLSAGVIDKTGRIAKDLPAWLQSLVRMQGNKRGFALTDSPCEVIFSQNDIRQVQLAKGAIRSGIVSLLQSSGIAAGELDKVIVAGQFGSHLSEESLIATGILPPESAGKITYIGNSSLVGAVLALTRADALSAMKTIANEISYLELATYPEYSRLFMKWMNFE